MKFYLVNAFSVNMLDRVGQAINFVPVSPAAVSDLLRNEDWESGCGHATGVIRAAIRDGVRGRDVPEIPINRVNLVLNRNTSMIVAQYRGPRLQEGATKLPKGATVEFWQAYLA